MPNFKGLVNNSGDDKESYLKTTTFSHVQETRQMCKTLRFIDNYNPKDDAKDPILKRVPNKH